MNILLGQQFEIRETEEIIRLIQVIDRQGGKKLTDPILKFAYYSKRPEFTTYQSQVERHLKSNSWLFTKI